MNGKKPDVPGAYIDRRILSVPPFDCTQDSEFENCDLVYLDLKDSNQEKCLSCKEDFYLIDGACTGKATGDLKGCHSGTATACGLCNPYFDYVMYLPGRCAKKSEITEEFMIKAREIAAYSHKITASLTAILFFFGLQL